MAEQFLNTFRMYQNALLRLGLDDEERSEKISKSDAKSDIKDVIAMVSTAEKSLSAVVSVSNSYNMILKMIA
ncbi:MAG: hypothetical protein IJ689_04665 [Alphaproteobacteria bacterium]|nr:hypothetical protein [Alphaproteobacteria bacterium]